MSSKPTQPEPASWLAFGEVQAAVRRLCGAPPRYGNPIAGSSSVTGYHFSRQVRTSLTSEYYGTGLRGSEARRLGGSENADIRPRMFFYLNKGNGIHPESGVGGYCHHVQMDNLYDVARDALNIVKGVRGKSRDRLNKWERAVLAAGFDGYLMDHPVMPQGYAVLLGKKHGAVPVERTQAPRVLDGWFDMLKTASLTHP